MLYKYNTVKVSTCEPPPATFLHVFSTNKLIKSFFNANFLGGGFIILGYIKQLALQYSL